MAIRSSQGKLEENSVCVITGPRLNSEYKLLSATDDSIATNKPLGEAVSIELQNLGSIVFVLIGEVNDSIMTNADIDNERFKTLQVAPSQSQPVKIIGSEISCNSVDDEASTWNSIEQILETRSLSESEIAGLKSVIGKAMDEVESKAYANLSIPRRIVPGATYFLDKIAASFKDNTEHYREALASLSAAVSNRFEAHNEVLRIAYNFTDDALTVLRLLVSVCDLKPLIMWGTFMSHYAVVETIRNLPWRRQITKPSLAEYINTVKRARNKSFHRLLPFTKPIDVDLPSQALRDVKLRFFSEHGSKENANKMDFRDKAVVDLLLEFTRTSQETVEDEFWKKNLTVMESSLAMVEQTAVFLKNCLSAQAS